MTQWRDLTPDEQAALLGLWDTGSRAMGWRHPHLDEIDQRAQTYGPLNANGSRRVIGRERIRRALLSLVGKNLVVRHRRALVFTMHLEGEQLVQRRKAEMSARQGTLLPRGEQRG